MKKINIIIIMIIGLFLTGCSTYEQSLGVSTYDGVIRDIDGTPYNALITQSYAHHEIHEGDHYYLDDKITLGNGGTRNILLVTPACNETKYVNLVHSASSTGIITTFALYENTTVSSLGTIEPIHNRNRVLNYLSLSTGYINPTITNTGTIISDEHWGVKEKQGGDIRDSEEIILNCGINYLIRVVSGEQSNRVNIKLDWYENELEE